jgi:cytochrome P450
VNITSVPGPSSAKLIYYFLRARGNRLFLIDQLLNRYGDIVKIKSGNIETILLSNMAEARGILVTNHSDYIRGNYPAWVKTLYTNGLIPADQSKHRVLRRPIQHNFNHSQLRDHANKMIATVADISESWQPDKALNFAEEMMKVTLSNVSACLIGKKPNHELELLRRSFQVLHHEFSKPRRIDPVLSRYLKKLPLPGNKKLDDALSYINAVTNDWIANAKLRETSNENNFLETLIKATIEPGSSSVNPSADIADTLKIFLSAGSETTASALCSIWFMLSQHPKQVLKLRDEINNVLGRRSLTFDDLDKFDLLDRVIRETLRLYPPVPGISREANRDVNIGGYKVRRGSRIVISPWSIHRQEKIFTQANDFIPDRWSDLSQSSNQRKAWNPFGLGARRCIAEQFAMIEIKIVIATIVREWHVQVAPSCKPKLETSMSLWLVRNLPVTLQKLNPPRK